jgi:oligopeptide transport system substrate-binding protein
MNPRRKVCLALMAALSFCPWKLDAAIAPALKEANRNRILLLCEGTEPRTLDPQIAQGVPEHHIIMAIDEGLVENDRDDQAKQIPGLADRWEHNPDYSVWKFHLRDNAKWSNGDPVTAQDFIFSYKRILTATLGAPYIDSLFILRGAQEYAEGKVTDFSQVGVKALDDRNLQFELVGPTPYFLSALLHTAWFPVHPSTILEFGRIDERDTKWTRPGNYVGTGPFMLKTWRENDVIELVRNPFYWDAANVKLNGINFYSIENYATQERAFRAGQLHKILQVPLDKVPYYRREHPELIRIDPVEAVYFYRINVKRKPLSDPKVRLALNLAVDRESIVRNITRAKQKPATSFTPPGMGDYKALDAIHYDPERARRLLAEAGYPNGQGFPKFDILMNTSEAHRALAEAIQQMWKQELNIDVGIENQEWRVFMDSMNRLNYDVARYGWNGDFMDPVTFLSIWRTGDGNNCTGWSNLTYDQLLDEAAHTGDPKERFAILHQAEQLWSNEPPAVVIYWYTNFYLLQPSVRNWNSLALDNHNYKFIDLEEDETPKLSLAHQAQ